MTIAPLTLHETQAEIQRGRAKFPGNRLLVPALVEEVGELVDAILAGDRNAVRAEAIQVACVAIRIAEEGDATVYNGSRFAAAVSCLGRVARACLQRNGERWYHSLSSLSLDRANERDLIFDDMTAEEMQP